MGFTSLIANTDVWFKASTEKYGNQYYTYIFVQVDDIIIVEKDHSKLMSTLMKNYTVKTSSIGEPNLYLGSDIGKLDYIYGSCAWRMRQDYYIKEAIRNVKKHMKDENMDFNKNISEINYSPKNTFYTVE